MIFVAIVLEHLDMPVSLTGERRVPLDTTCGQMTTQFHLDQAHSAAYQWIILFLFLYISYLHLIGIVRRRSSSPDSYYKSSILIPFIWQCNEATRRYLDTYMAL